MQRVLSALHIKSVQATFPSFSRRGDRAIQSLETRGRGGYLGSAKRSFLSRLLTDSYGFALSGSCFAPVCARGSGEKGREHYLMAQPSRLGKETFAKVAETLL
jgi:hypothetical protein